MQRPGGEHEAAAGQQCLTHAQDVRHSVLAVGICGDECAAALRVRSQMAQGAFQCAALAPVLRAGQDLGIGQQRGKNIRIGRAAAVVRDDQPEVLPVQGLHQ